MSLLSTDIIKGNRLSLREVKLPAIEPKVGPILVENTPSDKEVAYSKLVRANPLLAELVERLDLVSI
jgi:hypothetical protein